MVGRNSNFRFHTSHDGSVDYDKLMDIMSEARTTLSKPDIVACMTLLAETVSDLVADGKFVKSHWALFTSAPSAPSTIRRILSLRA